MPSVSDKRPCRLEDLPNIGKAIAGDLRSVGILDPEQLAAHEPLEIFQALEPVMGHRHDPCVLYALMAVAHYLKCGEALPWWKFTTRGKELLQSTRN